MEKVRVNLGERSYDIFIGDGILGRIGSQTKTLLKGGTAPQKTAIISNPNVYRLYGKKVFDSLKKSGFKPVKIIIPDGEEYKSLLWAENILTALLKARLDRTSLIIALGGGVIGDMAGFAASTYMRGIRFIQVPTTLLAQVDSSVGGKTGVNHPLGKNMIGTFYQPSLVWIDVNTLKTLQKRQFKAGMAEVIKYGVIWDRKLFEFLEKNKKDILSLKQKSLMHIIKRSCEIKAAVVSKDEREAGLRAILNYGHTVGHAIETTTGYIRYLHGEAVAIGMKVEASIASLNSGELSRIKKLIELYGLSSELPEDLDIKEMMAAMAIDKKAVSGRMRFVLPERIGSVRVAGVGENKIFKKVLKGAEINSA